MKTLLAAVTLALFCLSVQGQVIIYKNKIGLSTTGGGSTTKTKITGFTVINPTNGAVTRIEAYASSKNFSVFTIGYTVNTVRGNQGKPDPVFSYVDFYLDTSNNQVEDSETLKGLNLTIDIGEVGATQPWTIPRIMQQIGRTIYTLSGQAMIDETSGTLVYDPKTTLDANSRGLTFDQAVEQVKSNLLGQGYTQL